MFASIGVVEEEGVMEVERALACSQFVVYLALTPLAPHALEGTGTGNCFAS